jgi:hypothetical protein
MAQSSSDRNTYMSHDYQYEVYMAEGILLLVVKLNLKFKNERDHVAQVLLELACKSDLADQRRFNSLVQRHTTSTVTRILIPNQLFMPY